MPPAFKQGKGALADELLLPNYPQMTMPYAGGAGVVLLVVAGISLLGAATILIMRRRHIVSLDEG